MTTLSTPIAQPAQRRCDPAAATTRSLLGYGVLVGPAYAAAVTAQAVTRDGFDPLRHPASLLALGEHGWVQTATFLVAGVMVVLAATGMRRSLAGGNGGTWGPRLVGLFGVGMLAAAAFPLDPGLGFPAGAPEGPGELSWHGIGHLVAGGIAFPAIGAACVVVGGRLARAGDRAMAAYSRASAVVFAVCYLASVTQLAGPVNALVFSAAVATVLAWLTVTCSHLYRRAGRAH